MADTKTSALTAATTVDPADLVMTVDVSDTSMAASGTNKKATREQLQTYAAGTLTTDKKIADYSGTWNNAAVAFTGVKVNVTDTASDAGSLLADLQVGGTSKMSVSKAGAVTAAGAVSGTTLVSTVATGTAPLTVASTTAVTNLNADKVDGYDASAFVQGGGALGTPSSGTLTNCTGLPVSSGVSGLGTNVATALAVNVGSSGAVVVNGGALGTPSSGTLTNATGLPVSTGVSGLGTGVGTALAVNTGSAGAFVVNGGALGTPSSGTLTNATGLPVSTGVSGLGTGVGTALAVNTGTAGAFVVNGGALGTPSSGTVTNLTGTASININGTVGATTANTGAFTTLSASGVATFSAGTVSAPAITTTGDTNTGEYFPAADTIGWTTGGTERMRVDSSGNVGIGTSSPTGKLCVETASSGTQTLLTLRVPNATNNNAQLNFSVLDAGSDIPVARIASVYGAADNIALAFSTFNLGGIGERMRIDKDGNVGIGTSSPDANAKLDVSGTIRTGSGGTDPGTGAALYFVGSGSFQTVVAGAAFAVNTGNNNARTERMRIDKDGNVGIGTTAPSNKLHVLGSSNDTINVTNLNVKFEGGGGNGMGFGTLSSAPYMSYIQSGFLNNFSTAVYNLLLNPLGGEVYVAGTTDQGAYNLQCNGTGVWGAGAYVNGSDSRIKEDVAPIASGLDVVSKLKPVTYRYKESWSKDQSIQPGFIAQELLTALDGQVYVDGVVQQGGAENYYSVAYQNIIPILTKAIQEQQAQIEALKAEVAALKG